VWLSSNSSEIYASEVAEVGSIGVVMEHASHEKRLEKEGIKVTQIKSSDKKAMGSPAKDLTAEEISHLQDKVDEKNALFKKQLYAQRPGIQEEAFSGETFSAQKAQQLGLIDGIKTFSQVFEQLSAAADSENNSSREVFPMRRKLTASMAEAAIEAGADPTTIEIVSQEEYDALQAAGDLNEEETQEENLEDKDENLDAEDEDLGAKDETEEDQVVALQTELAEAVAQVETLTQQVEDLTGQLEASKSDPLRKIAEDRVATMRVALGLTKVSMEDFTVTSLLQEYEAVDKQFKKAFVPGGVKSKTTDTKETKIVKMTHDANARLRAVGLNK
jgi:hypothetical protein